MARLPTPGSDDGQWGIILNDFLSVEHSTDGSLKIRTDGTFNSFVQTSGAQSIAGVKTFTSSPVVPTPSNNTDAANKAYVDGVAMGGAPDATTLSKGIVQLAGDLAGTATSPTVPGLANKQDLDADLTAIAGLSPSNDDIIQRKSGAWANRTPAQFKTDLALTKTDVGLSNVDNTSDANKPVSTATQTALNLKANTGDVVLLAGDNTATFTNAASTNGFATINLNYTATGSTPDAFAFYYNGVRTGYHNEKGELRSRAAADNSVPFRVQQRSGTQTANLTEWTQSNNTILSYVASDGQIHAPNLDASAWQTLTYPTNAAAASGFATAGVRLEPLYNLARLRGAIQITSPGFSADTTLATIPSGYRPTATVRMSTRFAGTGAAGAFITINTDGTITCSSALTNSNNVLPLDGIVYPL